MEWNGIILEEGGRLSGAKLETWVALDHGVCFPYAPGDGD